MQEPSTARVSKTEPPKGKASPVLSAPSGGVTTLARIANVLRSRPRSDSLPLRLLTAIVAIPALIALVWFNAATTSLLAAVVVVVSIDEFCRLGIERVPLPLEVASQIFGVLFILNSYLGGPANLPLVAGTILVPMFLLVFQPADQRRPSAWAWAVAGTLLIGWTLSLGVSLRLHTMGREWVIIAGGLAFAVDSAAYFVGKAIGRHKMAPRISPGKTWEGALGGFVMGGIAGVVLLRAFGLHNPWWQALLLGLACAIVGELGDVAESMIKRSVGAKDAGIAVPGHGGLLDRLDSLIPTIALVYFFAVWLG
jgi:phosphatidate cytidylyltransferase